MMIDGLLARVQCTDAGQRSQKEWPRKSPKKRVLKDVEVSPEPEENDMRL